MKQIVDLSVVWVVKVCFPCSELFTVLCFHRFHRVDSPTAEGAEKWGCNILERRFGTAGKDSLVG